MPIVVVAGDAGLVNSGIRLTSLDLSHNQLKLVSAAPLATILGGAVLQHVPTQLPQSVDELADSGYLSHTQEPGPLSVTEAAADQLPPLAAAESSARHEADASPSTSASSSAAQPASVSASGLSSTAAAVRGVAAELTAPGMFGAADSFCKPCILWLTAHLCV